MNINHFQKQLAAATSIKQLEAVLKQYLHDEGMSSYAVTYYAGHTRTGNKLIYDLVSPALKPWHQYYLEQKYADVDRTLEQSHQMTLPLYWDVQQQLAQAKNNREKRIRQESIEFGIDKGLSLPIHGPDNDFAILVLHQRVNETGLQDYLNKQYQWLSAALLFIHYLRVLLPKANTDGKIAHLTQREQQCLTMTARDMRTDAIANALNIKERTVNFHLQNANKKLGTKNKYQSVIKFKTIDVRVIPK